MTRVLPTFLVLGAPRAGTTSLHHWLGQHPDICVSRPKETELFSLHAEDGLAGYQPYFAHHAGEKIIGETTPMYLSLPHVPGRIAAALPDVSLLVVLREPVGQAYSSWWMMRNLGVERRPFEVAVRDELAAPPLPESDAQAYWSSLCAAAARGHSSSAARYLMIGHYRTAIDRYLRHFDRGQLTLLLHDDLRTNPEWFLRTVCGAVGAAIERAPTLRPPHSNEGRGARQAWVERRVRNVPSARLRRAAVSLAARTRPVGPPPLSDELHSLLCEHFAAANEGLDSLVGRDVSAWFGGADVTP